MLYLLNKLIKNTMYKIIRFRAITSSLLIISFVITTITGIGLYLAPNGYLAKIQNWTFLGLDKRHLENLHTNFGFIMTFLVILHFIINAKMFKTEIKNLFILFKKQK